MLQCLTMANCPSCGSGITHAVTETGDHVPLENFEDVIGSDRYRIVKVGPPHVVQLLAASSPSPGYPDHRRECPAHGNGQR